MSNKDFLSSNALAVACAYAECGWHVVLLPYGQKHPPEKGWQRRKLTVDEIRDRFAGEDCNVGVGLGDLSGGLVDVDIDNGLALRIAHLYLPPTDCIFGRPTRPKSHHLYRCSPPPKPHQYSLPQGVVPEGEKAVIVELRSNGQYTVLPPSLHPDGEQIQWQVNGQPAPVAADALRRGAALLAIATIIGSVYPPKGRRHELALALSGALLRQGLSTEEVKLVIRGAVLISNDEELEDRLRAVDTTAEKLGGGETVTGFPTLAEITNKAAAEEIEKIAKDFHNSQSPYKVIGNVNDSHSHSQPKVEPKEFEGVVRVCDVTEPPPRKWIVPNLLPTGCLSMWFGDPGTFKSTIALALAVAKSGGQTFLGHQLERGLVVYADSEWDLEEFSRRAYSVSRGFGLANPPWDLLYYRLEGNLRESNARNKLTELVAKYSPEVIVLDSLMFAALGIDWNTWGEVAEVLQGLKALVGQGAVLVLDHTPSPSLLKSNNKPYGSVAKLAAIRHMVHISKQHGGVLLEVTKSNVAESGYRLPIAVSHSTDANGRDVWAVAVTTPNSVKPLSAEAQVLLIIEEYDDGGGLTAKEIAEYARKNERTIANYLSELRKENKVVRLGGGRWSIPKKQESLTEETPL